MDFYRYQDQAKKLSTRLLILFFAGLISLSAALTLAGLFLWQLTDQVVHIDTTDDMKLRNVLDVLESKFVKRGISIKSLKYGKIESSLGGRVKQDITVQVGLDKDQTKKIVAKVKDLKLKVQASIQGDSVRITGKNKDDLQVAIAALKAEDFDFAVQFTNYR